MTSNASNPYAATADLCLACGASLPNGLTVGQERPARCPVCRAPLRCPRGRDMPDAVKQLVLRRHLASYFAPQGGPDQGWPLMLANAFRGSIIDVVAPTGTTRRCLITMAEGPDAIYPAALVAAGLHDTTAQRPQERESSPSPGRASAA